MIKWQAWGAGAEWMRSAVGSCAGWPAMHQPGSSMGLHPGPRIPLTKFSTVLGTVAPYCISIRWEGCRKRWAHGRAESSKPPP